MINGYTNTWYADTVSGFPARPALAETIHTDVCVIGGGLAGLNVALGLAERSKKTVVLEGNRIGWGASGRNGGKALSGFAASFPKIVSRAGEAGAIEIYKTTVDALKLIRQRVKDYNIDCNLVDGVVIASWYDEKNSCLEDVEFETKNFGLDVEFVPRETFREWYKSPRYYDGLYYPDYFHFNPLKYAHGIARAAESKSAKIFEDTYAIRVEEKSSGFIVHTKNGAVHADHVVYCTSAYANGVEKRLEWAAIKVSSFMAVTNPVDPEIFKNAITVPYGVYDSRWGCDYYRPLPDGRLLWGGGVGINSMRTPFGLTGRIERDILKVYPQLTDKIRIEKAWTGTMASTLHRMPHIGKFKDGLWFCTNFGNNGLGPTTAGGEIIAAAIAQDSEKYRIFEPFGVEYPGEGLLPCIGPYAAQGVYTWWRTKDLFRQTKENLRNINK